MMSAPSHCARKMYFPPGSIAVAAHLYMDINFFVLFFSVLFTVRFRLSSTVSRGRRYDVNYHTLYLIYRYAV